MNLFERFRRFLTSRGFGVHSPFAFRFITEIVGERYAYYGYDDIETAIEKHPEERKLRRHSRLLLRIAGRIGIDTAILAGDAPFAIKAAVEGAGKRIRIISPEAKTIGGKSLLLFAISQLPEGDALRATLNTDGSAIVVLKPAQSLKEELWERMQCGILIDGVGVLIAVVKKEIAKACYEILI